MNTRRLSILLCMAGLVLCLQQAAVAQILDETVTKRSKLWEILRNDGFIGSLGAWDFMVSYPLGMYPGFEGFTHPIGGESQFYEGNGTFSNANFHQFRGGCWIAVKNLTVPRLPPEYNPTQVEYEIYYSGHQDGAYGVASTRSPLVVRKNYIEAPGFDPDLPEEMIDGWWHTNTTITVNRRSYAWSFPGFRDFIIYDYIFKNTGQMVSNISSELVTNKNYSQTVNDALFVFHSGVSVSTKSQINFHTLYQSVAAGGFGWNPCSYHDFYHQYDNGELVFSTNYNGGRAPLYWWECTGDGTGTKDSSDWVQRFGSELHSPAAFGWLALYASPKSGIPRPTPKPDVLRIDSHKGGRFQGSDLNLEIFNMANNVPKQMFYDFARTPDSTGGQRLGNSGVRENFFTFTYGPYQLAPGDSLRFVVAEIAGVMDYREIVAGDPTGHFRDSAIAAIRRNADNARKAVLWGMGGTKNGIPVAADVPEPPPTPFVDALNASAGLDSPIVAITWDKLAETSVIRDGAGGTFYDGANDLDGYRVYRSTDFQFVSDEEPPVLRGAWWDLVADIPKTQFANYWDAAENKYRFLDGTVRFGYQYGYYVAAYRNTPRPWTSVNGTTVNNLPPMEGGDCNRPTTVTPVAGPSPSFDIFTAPNPYIYGDPNRSFGLSNPFKIEFRNLPEKCTIRIYTVMGDLVRTIHHQPDQRGNVFGTEAWDQKSESGLLVAPGLYVYHVKSLTPGLDREFTGKLMIIR